MDWPEALPALLTGLAVLFVPGLPVGLALKLRVFDAVALAPLISVTLISVSAILAPMAGISWSVLPLAVLTVLVTAATFLVGRLYANTRGKRTAVDTQVSVAEQLPWFAGAAVAFLLIGWQVVHVIGSPENFSQTFDNIFHLNAIQYVLETGNASSLTLTSMTSADQPAYFYPAAWHGLVSLILQLSGASITLATTAAVIAVSAAVWPLSVLFAVRHLARVVPAVSLGAGVLVGGFSAFPILVMDFGVLYPNMLSLAMVPAAVMILAIILRQAPATCLGFRQALFLAPLTLPGVAVAHPNGMMTVLVLILPAVVSAYIYGVMALASARAKWYTYALATGALAAVLAVYLVVWNVIRPPEAAAFWDRVQTAPQALGEALLNAPFGRPAAVAVSLLVILGLVQCFRKPKMLWFAGSYFLVVWLFVVASGYTISDFRMFVTGVYYNDPYRLAALLPIAGAPLAVLGLQLVLQPVDRILRDRLRTRDWARPAAVRATAPMALGIVAVLVLLPLTQRASMDAAIAGARAGYSITDDSALVSTDELALIEELPELTPEDAVIAVNPWTGGALAYALAGRDTTYKHTLSNTTPEGAVVDNSLKDAGEDPEVCEAAEEIGVDYVLDFGEREVNGGHHRYPGLEDLEGDSDFEKVTSIGEASLYRFVGCR